ncbi:MAG: endonuclease MutS2 [Chloroflexi bacterium]|nr:endonuclease MutS2 [Chloroflexota bacterium]
MTTTNDHHLSPPTGHDPAGESLSLLEFPLIREKVAGLTSLPMAREEALALSPSSNADEIAYRQQETQEARRFIEGHGSLDLSGVRDLRPLVQRASLEGPLKGESLREIHDTLRACRNVRSALANRKDLPQLSTLARSIPSLRDLEGELASSVDLNGLVVDDASPALRGLRSRAEEAHVRLTDALERTVRRLRRSNVLQEPLVTERNGRLVLLVKTEMRHRVPGIVHDVSDSGATAFVEPLRAVSLGNEWREASLAAQREEERILRILSSKVGLLGDDILYSLDVLAKLDLALAKGRYSLALNGVPPVFIQADTAYVSLTTARHPLLRDDVVPIDISLGGESSVLLITGPNAGGKTVALKTTGLLSAMAQAGLHVPAKQCTMTVLDYIYADIGDQQSIERSLSSFSSHIQTLGAIMDKATPASLVLLDELGTSTDPEEGAALAKAVLSYFGNRKIPCVATTHHRDVAAYVQDQPGMTNASVELDPRTLAPTYRLTVGLPGRSYALTIAGRMGIDPQTLERAHSLLSAEHRQAEELLRQLEEERYLAEQQRKAAQEELAQAQETRRDLEEKLRELEEQKNLILEEARRQLQVQADELWKRLQRAERALTRPETRPQLKDQRADVARVRNELRSALWQPPQSGASGWIGELKPGDYVYVRGIPNPVEVLSPPDKGNAIELLLGSIKARLPSYQLEKKAQAPPLRLPEGVTVSRAPSGPASTELDIRGLRVEEAEGRLEVFLDQAVLKGLSSVRVIHGGGTGALRAMVRERLKGHPLVKTARPEKSGITDGVTTVELN